jgi:arylsulfatase
MKTYKMVIHVLLACALLSIFSAAHAQDKPNIVLVFLDNFGWGEPGFNGGGIIRGAATPRMDTLAAEGLRLTNFNVESQCTPSRSAIMTGRYAIRSGTGQAPQGGGVYGLVQWEVTLAEMLADAGYATGMFGKWHLGRTPGRFPTDQGFDEWYGIPNSTDEAAYMDLEGFKESGLPEASFVMEAKKGETPKKMRPYRLDYRPFIDADLTDKAIDFMKRKSRSKKPFFCFLPYTATHYPTRPHPDFAGKSGNGPWADLLLQIDAYLGRILDTIDDLGIRDNTIVIFTADNGPEMAHGNNTLTLESSIQGTAGPWRGTLFTGFEGSLRVPFAIRWPGKIPAGASSNEIVHEMDLFPTLAKFAGGKVPNDRVIDGIEMADFFSGKKKKSGREGVIVYMGNDVYGVKWRNWKINFKELDTLFGEVKEYGIPKVYNLYNDPQERENVLFPNTWVPKAAMPQLIKHVMSLRKEPPIKPGTRDPYKPPKSQPGQ